MKRATCVHTMPLCYRAVVYIHSCSCYRAAVTHMLINAHQEIDLLIAFHECFGLDTCSLLFAEVLLQKCSLVQMSRTLPKRHIMQNLYYKAVTQLSSSECTAEDCWDCSTESQIENVIICRYRKSHFCKHDDSMNCVIASILHTHARQVLFSHL